MVEILPLPNKDQIREQLIPKLIHLYNELNRRYNNGSMTSAYTALQSRMPMSRGAAPLCAL